MRKLFIVTLIFILFISFIGLIVQQQSRSVGMSGNTGKRPNKTLSVAMDTNIPGYFSFNGTSFGFNRDMLERFAEHIGARLVLIPQNDLYASMQMLATGKVDMVVTMSKYTELCSESVKVLPPLCQQQYLVMTREKPKGKIRIQDLKKLLSHKSGVVKQDFTGTRTYGYWLDSIGNNSAVVSYDNTHNLMTALDKKQIDYLVCERQEADMVQADFPNIHPLYVFEAEESSALFVNSLNKGLENRFNEWLEAFRNTPGYANLYNTYFRNSIWNNVSPKNIKERISAFDDLFKSEAAKAGHDWRFVSAIAYHESRFKPNVVSRCGARGIMQIMPSIARSFNVSPEEIQDPRKNIEVALLLLNKIEQSLKFSTNTSDYDKLCIILACYNAGIGHVMDARRLAAKYGENPNNWESVAKYLQKKAEATYYTDNAVRQGRFSGRETLSFVSNVMGSYTQYCKKNI